MNMAGEFADYSRYPGFWFYIAMTLAADISSNPYLSAKYTKHPQYSYDIFEMFDKALKIYEKRNKVYGR